MMCGTCLSVPDVRASAQSRKGEPKDADSYKYHASLTALLFYTTSWSTDCRASHNRSRLHSRFVVRVKAARPATNRRTRRELLRYCADDQRRRSALWLTRSLSRAAMFARELCGRTYNSGCCEHAGLFASCLGSIVILASRSDYSDTPLQSWRDSTAGWDRARHIVGFDATQRGKVLQWTTVCTLSMSTRRAK